MNRAWTAALATGGRDAWRRNFDRLSSARNLLLVLAALLLLDWALTGVRVIREDQQGVIVRFGRVTHVVPPGILFTLPWPIDRTIAVRTAEVRTMPVGYKFTDAVRGVAPSTQESEWVTGDINILMLTLTIKYVVSDPVAYLFHVGAVDADFLIRRCAEANLTKLIATLPVDELLTSGKIRVQEETRTSTQAVLDELDVGLRLVSVNIGEVVPPANVIAAFNDVSTAKSEKAKLINEADGYQKDLLPRARAMANRMIQEAESYRAERVNGAQGATAGFLKLLVEANQARGITETRLYLEAMERILPRPRKVILDAERGSQIRLIE
ncbi:MAG: FtsH protease activity modulator HflK [Candidatus Eisenbacteria bacterium]